MESRQLGSASSQLLTIIAILPTGFEKQGAQCHLVSSLSCAREMLYQTWDKNDRKDTKVILYLLNQGISRPFYDPLVNKTMTWSTKIDQPS